jgi:hypothetical protein
MEEKVFRLSIPESGATASTTVNASIAREQKLESDVWLGLANDSKLVDALSRAPTQSKAEGSDGGAEGPDQRDPTTPLCGDWRHSRVECRSTAARVRSAFRSLCVCLRQGPHEGQESSAFSGEGLDAGAEERRSYIRAWVPTPFFFRSFFRRKFGGTQNSGFLDATLSDLEGVE